MHATQDSEDRLDMRRVLPIFVVVLVDLLGLTIIIPLLPLYAASFGASPLVIGVLGATYPIMQFIGAPILGRLSDRYGRRPVLIVSQVGTLVGFVLLALANSIFVLFLSRVIDGLSGANIATAQAAISDSTTPRTRTQGMGLIGAAFGLGFVIGPIIAFASLAATGNDYHAPAFVAAGFSLASIILTATWFRETLPPERRQEAGHRPAVTLGAMARAVRHPAVGALLVLAFLQQFAFGGFEQILALFNLSRLGLGARGNALVFVIVGVLVVVVQGGLVGRWSRRYGERRLIRAGLALLAAGLLLLAFTPPQPPPTYSRDEVSTELGAQRQLPGETPPTQDVTVELPSGEDTGWLGVAWLLGCMVPLAIGGGVLYPSISSLLTKRVDLVEVGGTLGLSAAFVSAANALAPIVGGALFQRFGDAAPFLAFSGVMGLAYAFAVRRLGPGREEPAESAG